MLSSTVLRALRAASIVRGVSPLVFAFGLAACAKGSTVDAASNTGSAGTAGRGGDSSSSSASMGGTGGTGGSTAQTGGATTGGTTASSGGSTSSGSGAGGGFVASACGPGEFATGLKLDETLACVPFAPLARDAINNGCSLHLGWRDGCTGCGLPPTKWGHTSPAACENIAGVNDTCITPMLDGAAINLFGLNFDGNVNDDDQIYLGLDCPAGDGKKVPGPCKLGQVAVGIDASGAATCMNAGVPVLDHLRTDCGLYFGWRDKCDNCTSAPDRWGQVSPTGCTLGSGGTNTCTTETLGSATIQLFGLSTGGDVDGNDKLYMAFHCDDPKTAMSMVKGTCPPGQLITAAAADGTLTCESPEKVVADYVDAHCTFYYGWRDSCNGCTDPPSKWGRVRNGFCTNDNGVDNTCAESVLGGKTLQMFGLNPDGDVDDDDKLYVGYRCD